MPAISDQDMNAMLAEESRVSVRIILFPLELANAQKSTVLTGLSRFTAAHNRVQHELRPARTLHLRNEVQRAINCDAGRRRVLSEAEAGLQVGASAQHNGAGRAAVILA